MEIVCVVFVMIISILDHCLCCRSIFKPVTNSQEAPLKNASAIKVRVASNLHEQDNCRMLSSASKTDVSTKQDTGLDDITLCYIENDIIEVICDGSDLPPGSSLMWHHRIIDNKTFSTPLQKQNGVPYYMKLHLNRFDNGSYVYCTVRTNDTDVMTSKSIYFLLNNASTLPGFDSFMPFYYDPKDSKQSFRCQNGIILIVNSTNGVIEIYNGNHSGILMTESDNGTLGACGYYKQTCNRSPDKCKVERVIENKHIFLYKNEVTAKIIEENSDTSVFIITGVSVAIITVCLIISTAICCSKNKCRRNTRSEEPNNITFDPLTYADLELTESSPSQRRILNDTATYTTITGVLAKK